jgi:peptide-methionine (S)-S-oxide reductase
MWMFERKTPVMIDAKDALPGRASVMPIPATHDVNGMPLRGPWPGTETALFGMGCFWGAERKLWQQPGVVLTAVGYAGGYTKNPTYEETCTGKTGHTEVVLAAWDSTTSLEQLLAVFWESHDPTQGMRQGNDVGTQYRSAIFVTTDAQLTVALASRDAYQAALKAAGHGTITTEIKRVDVTSEFFYAEGYHQQYLAKNPNGYCGLEGTGVSCPIGLGVR